MVILFKIMRHDAGSRKHKKEEKWLKVQVLKDQIRRSNKSKSVHLEVESSWQLV